MPNAAPFDPSSLPLRDIHLPPAVSWWPPAPGWWLLALLLLGLLAGGGWLWRRHQQGRYRRLALQRLQQLERDYRQHPDPQRLLQELSRLLRQAAQLHFSPARCAGLVGEQWLRFLDQRLADSAFTQGVGQVLASGPYRPRLEAVEVDALLSLCRRWLRSLPRVAKRGGRR